MEKLIVANWKMNPASSKKAEELVYNILPAAKKSKRVEIVICPPFPYLSILPPAPTLRRAGISRFSSRQRRRLGGQASLKLGAQDVFWEGKGSAFTGEVSIAMLKDLGVEYVIVGHSERRRWLGETDEMINKKVLAVIEAGLKVILCVGEPASVRKSGLSAAKKFVRSQLMEDLKSLNSKSRTISSRLIVAYEPIWAIGTGRSDKPEDTVQMARFIKDHLSPITNHQLPKVLYGGSVNGKNAESFIQYSEIDGALVGGASLKVEEFKKIISVSSNK